MSVVSMILDKVGIRDVTLAQADDFEKWLLNYWWNKYSEERMNKRIIVENQIRDLNIRLTNGTVNKEYLQEINLPSDLVRDIRIDGLEELGLSSETTDDNKIIIKGKPVQAGDFDVKLCFKIKDWIDGEEISCLKIPVAFNPDPRSLWKNIPTDKETTSFFKEDSVCDYIKVEAKEGGEARKDIVVASQRGRSHAQEGKPRDDHYNVFHCEESGWYVLSVADGAGSAKYSRKGSQIACDTVVDFCKEQLKSNIEFETNIRDYQDAEDKANAQKVVGDMIYKILGTAAHKAYKAINDFAADKAVNNPDFAGVKTKDFATTLLLAICKKFDFGWFVATFWVGDGALCIYNADKNSFKLLGEPDEGEFSGQTRFLTMPEIFTDATSFYKRFRFSIEDDFTALFLMTDGVSDPMFETDVNLRSIDKWHQLYNSLQTGFPEDQISGVKFTDNNEESKYQLLRWLDFWSPGNHDDRTIAILY